MLPIELNTNELRSFSRKVYLASSIVILIYYISIFYGIHHPFSISFVQSFIAIIFFISLFWLPYKLIHLAISFAPPLYYFIQIYLLTDTPAFEILIPFYKNTTINNTNGVDINRAIDSARQGTLYIWLCLLTFYLCQDKEIKQLFLTSFGVLGVILLALAFTAPQNNTNVLWFHSIPTLIDGWGSTSINTDLSAGFGFIWNFKMGDTSITYPIKQVSSTIIGSVFNENNYASLIGILLPFIIALPIYNSRNKNLSAVLSVSVIIATIYTIWIYANSRGGTIALFATSIIFILSIKIKLKKHLLLLSCLFISILFTISITEYFDDNRDTLLSGRLTLWNSTLNIIKESPLFGIGTGNIQSVGLIRELDTTYTNQRKEWLINYYSHNVYLEWLAENGIFGLLTLVICLSIFLPSIKRIKLPAKAKESHYIFFSICFIIFHSALDYSPIKPYTGFIFFILTGWYVALFYRTKKSPHKQNRLIYGTGISIMFLLTSSIVVTAFRFFNTDGIIRSIENSVSPVFIAKYSLDNKAEENLDFNENLIREKLLKAELYFKTQRPNSELAQSIGKGYYLLSRGSNDMELITSKNWFLISEVISPKNILTNQSIK